VAWVHPTWRDLVIERLAADATLRRHFLSRCGAHGMVLALSTAGGTEGRRNLPLLTADEDWDALGDRIYALLPELDSGELVAVLTALGLAVQDLGDGSADGEARAMTRMALTRIAKLWERDRSPITLTVLDAWLSVSAMLDPPLWPPSLATTWAELLPARAPDPRDVSEVQRFADWVTLCDLLSSFSPALVQTLGFGRDQTRVIEDFLRRVGADLEFSGNEPAIRALEATASFAPGLAGRARRLSALLREGVETPDWLAEVAPDPALGGQAHLASGEGIDVGRVLADL
jgi:hypothetical protein